jgi:hypothetical protein
VCGRQDYYHPCVNRLSMAILSGNRPLTSREIQLGQPLRVSGCGWRMSSTFAGGQEPTI